MDGNTIPKLEMLAHRLGVPCKGLSQRQLKESLAAALFKKHEPIYAPYMIPPLSDMRDSGLDEVIDRLTYDEQPKLFDPPLRKRTPDTAPIIFSQIEQALSQQRHSNVTRAARSIHPKWKDKYKQSKVLADIYFQSRQKMDKLQEHFTAAKRDLLLELLARFSNDEPAMSLWGAFCRYGQQLYHAYEEGDLSLIIYAKNKIDSVLTAQHPFALGLILLFAPAQKTYIYVGSLFERLQSDKYRQELLADTDIQDYDQIVAAVVALLGRHGLHFGRY